MENETALTPGMEMLRLTHGRAFMDLAEYAAECPIQAERLNPLLNARTIDEAIAARGAIEHLQANSHYMEALHDSLCHMA